MASPARRRGSAVAFVRSNAKRQLPEGYPVDVHFKPSYDPWDQRLCAILDNDFYETIAEGRLDVVTDQIDHIDATGIVLRSGERIDADVIITATGIQLQALGGVALSVDGAEVKPQDRFVYKEHMLEDIPNAAWSRRLHQRLVDAARRPHRPFGCEAIGVHGFPRLHTRLPPSG